VAEAIGFHAAHVKAIAKRTCSAPLMLAAAASVPSLARAGTMAHVTGNAPVDRLLSEMTLAEKLTLIHDGREGSSKRG